MGKMAEYAFVAGTLSTILALIGYLLYALSGVRAARQAAAGVPMMTGGLGFVSGPRTTSIGHYATLLGWLGFAALAPAWSSGPSQPATGHSPTCTSSRSPSRSGSSARTTGSSASTTSAS